MKIWWWIIKIAFLLFVFWFVVTTNLTHYQKSQAMHILVPIGCIIGCVQGLEWAAAVLSSWAKAENPGAGAAPGFLALLIALGMAGGFGYMFFESLQVP